MQTTKLEKLPQHIIDTIKYVKAFIYHHKDAGFDVSNSENVSTLLYYTCGFFPSKPFVEKIKPYIQSSMKHTRWYNNIIINQNNLLDKD